MKPKREPLDRLFRSAAQAPAKQVEETPFGWETRVLQAVSEHRAANVAVAIGTIWRQGVFWAFATAVLVASFSAWNIRSTGLVDPERLALEPVEIYQVLR